MASRESAFIEITPEVLLKAYACGIFPMAESADDPALFWIEPEKRGVIPLERFHLPSRLARTVRSDRFRHRHQSRLRGRVLVLSPGAMIRTFELRTRQVTLKVVSVRQFHVGWLPSTYTGDAFRGLFPHSAST